MLMLMNILRKMLLVFLAALLPLFLFWLAISTGVTKMAGSSENIKETLAKNDVYSVIIPGALDQAKAGQAKAENGGAQEINLSDPAIKTVAERTFTPKFLQENTEKMLDSIFLWLDGKTQTPDFRIDLSGLKATFAAEAAKVAKDKAASLPACPSGLSGSSDNFDPFSATCLPVGLTPAAAAQQVQDTLNRGEDFLENPVITADTLESGSSGQSIFSDQLKSLPRGYQWFNKTPFILAVLSVLCILGVVFLSTSRRAGLRRAGLSLLTVGISFLIIAWALNYGINQKVAPEIKFENKDLQDKLRGLVADITGQVNATFWTFGGSYAALGALAIGVPIFIHRRKVKPAAGHASSNETQGSSQPPASAPEIKPKPPRKPPAKIQ